MNELIRTLADFAISAAWQSGIVAAAALLALPLLRRASGGARHAVLVAALVACALVPWLPAPRARGAVGSQPAEALGTLLPSAGWAEGPPLHRSPYRPVPELVAGVYVAMTARAALSLARSFRRASQLRRSAAVRVIRSGGVPIHFCDDVKTPVTVGFLRPVVLLPSSLPADLRRAVLGHELAHVRRRDALLQALLEIVTLPVAFHPLVAMLKRHVMIAREIACDERVTPSRVEPRRYARALLAIAASNVTPSAAVAFGEAAALQTRLLALRERPTRRGLYIALAVSVVVLAIAAGATRFPLDLFGSKRHSFNGEWVLDDNATDFGGIAPYDSFLQTLTSDGDRLESRQTRVRRGQTEHLRWSVRADGITRPLESFPGEGSAHWEGDSLVLELTAGGHWERVRATVDYPDTLRCDGVFRDGGTRGRFRFVFRRKESA